MIPILLGLVSMVVGVSVVYALPGGAAWRSSEGRTGGPTVGTDGTDCYGLTAEQRAAGWSARMRRDASGKIRRPVVVERITPSGTVNAVGPARRGCEISGDELVRTTSSSSTEEPTLEERGVSPYSEEAHKYAIAAVRTIADDSPSCGPVALTWLEAYRVHARKKPGFLGIPAAYRRARLGALARELGTCASGVDLKRFGLKDAGQLVVALISLGGTASSKDAPDYTDPAAGSSE